MGDPRGHGRGVLQVIAAALLAMEPKLLDKPS